MSFEGAATVFPDTLSATGADPDHSLGEERYVTFGVSIRGPRLVVAQTERGGTIWSISARRGTKRERNI